MRLNKLPKYEKGSRKMKENKDIKEMLGQALSSFTKGEYSESICNLSKILLLDPKHQLAYLTRGVAYTKTDRVNLAIQDFDRAIETNPEYDRAYHLRGVAYASLGEHEKAVQDFDKAIALNPEYGAAYLSRANVHAEMGHDEEAQEDMEMVKRLTAKNVQGFAEQNNVVEFEQSQP
jgi:Tfp pilus assembly protein PilF